MKYHELVSLLLSQKDPKFAEFSQSLSNSDYISIGVKNPVLRQIIKDHLKDEELLLEDFELGKYLEVDFIYFGLAVSRLKTNKEKLDFLKKKIHLAKSWGITDSAATYFKKLSFEDFWDFFIEMYQSKYIYDRRMAYVLGLKFYQDERIIEVLKHINKNEEYIVMMAEAWLFATVAIKYPDEIYNFLKKLDDLTLKRKTISKISDSFRFNEQTKNKFKELRQH